MERRKKVDGALYAFLTYLLMGLTLAPAALAYVAALLGLWRVIGWLASL